MQNGIPVGLRSSPSFGLSRSGQLTAIIQSLFWDGSQGWWYDDNDTTTLFQDSAGTTPVTAVEQSVGLQLDKSKGLVLGPELVVNGDFSNGTTGFTKGDSNSTFSVVNGQLVCNSGPTTNVFFRQTINTIAGQAYFISADIIALSNNAAIRFNVDTLGIGESFSSTLGTRRTWFIATGATTSIQIAGDAANRTGTFDNISVRELPGNHRYAPASGNRPIWSKRVNLLTKTEQFDDAAWTKNNATVTANTVAAPDGTLTADTVTASAGAAFHYVNRASVPFAAASHTYRFYIKKATSQWVFFTLLDTTINYFDLNSGLFGTNPDNCTAVNVGNGWWYITITKTTTTTANGCGIGVASGNNGANFTAVGTEAVYVWGADLRPANQATGTMPLYQRVNTSSDYDTNGFPGYLKADGVDDFLQTNSINFTATDKITLCAGVRKLSDAARAMVTELGADVPQSFQFNAPSAAATTYSFASRGSAAASSAVYNNSAVAAPITNVATGIGDISGDSAILRINGTQVAASTTDQGTGNYGNYPAYFFRRGGTTLPFNGYEYGNVAVGKLLTADQLRALETYMNGLTKAY